MQEQSISGTAFVDMSDTIQKGLLSGLGYNLDEKGNKVGSKVSDVSHLTGNADTLGSSTANSEATQNRVLHTQEYAKQSSDLSQKKAE